MVTTTSPQNKDPSSSSGGGGDKLRDGPCQQEYIALEKCAQSKQNPNEATLNEKDRMQACPSQTDRLIRCIHKHPRFFQRA
jgi:GCK domain